MVQKDVDELRKEIVGSCPDCGGEGSVLEPQGNNRSRFVDCHCQIKLNRYIAYMRVGIPERFWEFKYSDLVDKFVEQNAASLGLYKIWLEEIPELVDLGAGVLLWSKDHGTAKTALASLIARRAIELGLTVRWVYGTDLFNEFMNRSHSDHSIIDSLDSYHLIVVDEVDKIYIPPERDGDPKMTRAIATEFFDKIYRSKVAVLATGNTNIQSLSSKYPEAIVDRMREWDEIPFVGVGFRQGVSYLQEVLKRRMQRDG